MKSSTLLLTLVATFLLTACSNEALLNRRENRLIGVWEFEKASFKENGDIFRDNITNEFEGDAIEFLPNYTALYDDFSLNAVFEGEWELFLDRNADGDEDDAEFFLDMTFFDFVNGENFSYFASATKLTNNNMTLIANTQSGQFRFKLNKID
ncbi:MAG: hypothetical protein AAGI23_18490 [Bacteroidota bacterium]